MLGTRLLVKPYERQHRNALLTLEAYSQWTHIHLDWYRLDQWLEQERGQVFLAWQGADIVGFIGLSQPIEGCCWIRALGLRGGHMPGLTVRELWERAETYCRRSGVDSVAFLTVTNWIAIYLRECGFDYADDVITLAHIGARRPALQHARAGVRLAEPHDVPRIAAVDRLAFAPLWRMTEDEIWQALRICVHATVAEYDGQVVAYQFGTRHDKIGHLARLAVEPAYQRRGIGSLLLRQFLADCERWQAETISVNTQLSNTPSQALYQRLGFLRNNKDLEFWRKPIA